MSRRRVVRRLRTVLRPVAAVVVLGGLLVGAIGFPVAPPGTLGGAFPCQGHGCGCRSAAECWFGCCCLTPSQRLAWAERNGVTPPAELVRVARRGAPATRKVASCCASPGKSACCGERAGAKTCCAKPGGKPVATRSQPEESDPVVVPGRCRGLGRWWVAAGQPLAPPERPGTLGPPAGSEPVLLGSVAYSLDADAPPTRPG